MNFNNAISYINSLLKFGIKPGLFRIKKLLNLMGNPQDNLKFIHVSGTNGKGSICKYVSSILQCAGYKTGLFISPFVLDFRERMQINGSLICESEFIEIVKIIKPLADKISADGESLTEFEFITAVAMQWFYNQKCDIVVLEVGLGGQFDATNVIKTALVSVIASISLDHTNILGNSIDKIANEKCGIIKNLTPVILYPEQPLEVIDIVKRHANVKNSKIIVPDKSNLSIIESNKLKSIFTYKNNTYEVRLPGTHQIINAITAIEVSNELIHKGYKISKLDIYIGLKKTKFVARLEPILTDPLVILDGAHNPGGATALYKYLSKNLKGKKLIAIIGMLKDKDVDLVLKTTLPCFSRVIATSPVNVRALSASELCSTAQKYCKNVLIAKSLDDAVNKAKNGLANLDGLVIFGSLYLASNIRPILLKYFN